MTTNEDPPLRQPISLHPSLCGLALWWQLIRQRAQEVRAVEGILTIVRNPNDSAPDKEVSATEEDPADVRVAINSLWLFVGLGFNAD